MRLTLIIIGLYLTACSGSSFQGDGSRKSDDKKKDTEKQESSSLDDPEDDEEIPVDHPAMVSGSFLTCQAFPGNATGKCRIQDSDDQIVTLEGIDVEWTVIDPFNRDLQKEVWASPEPAWHVYAFIGEEALPTARVQAKISAEGYTRTLESPVTEQKDIAIDLGDFLSPTFTFDFGQDSSQIPTPEKPGTTILGSDKDFQLGDDNFAMSTNRDCNEGELQATALVGTKIVFPLTIKGDDVNVGIILEDVCGATAYRTNQVRVLKGTEELVTKNIYSSFNNHTVSVPSFKASAGTYSLVIESKAKRDGDHDDFVVGAIRFNVDGEVEIGVGEAP